jgi:hypothetical protein
MPTARRPKLLRRLEHRAARDGRCEDLANARRRSSLAFARLRHIVDEWGKAMRNLALLLLLLDGCAVGALYKQAQQNEKGAAIRAQTGHGEEAARLQQQADAQRATAKMRAQEHGRLWSELTLD